MSLRFGEVAHPDGGLAFGESLWQSTSGTQIFPVGVESGEAFGPVAINGVKAEGIASAEAFGDVESVTLKGAAPRNGTVSPGGTIVVDLSGFTTPDEAFVDEVAVGLNVVSAVEVEITLAGAVEFRAGGDHALTRFFTNQVLRINDAAGGFAEAMIQIVPPDTDGPDDWFHSAAGSPYPADSIYPVGVEDGFDIWAWRSEGTSLELLANGTSSAASQNWGFELVYFDPTGAGWSALATKSFAPTLSPEGITGEEAFGVAQFALPSGDLIIVEGVVSGEVFGVMSAVNVLTSAGVAGAEAFGDPLVVFVESVIEPSGIAGAEAFGNLIAALPHQLFFEGLEGAEAFGTPNLLLQEVMQSIASEEAFGLSLVLSPAVLPQGIEGAEAFGSITFIVGYVLEEIGGIESEEAFPTPFLYSPGVWEEEPPLGGGSWTEES